MTMIAAIELSWVLLAGVGLGAVYFGGLWLTLLWLTNSRSPAGWVLLSLLVRNGVAVGGLYLLMAGNWQRLLVALLGMVLSRGWLMRHVNAPPSGGRSLSL